MLLIGDSMVTLGAFSKGRSSSAPVLHLCRRLAALCLGLGVKCYWRWVPTDHNNSDGPSRGGPLGVMAKAVAQAIVRLPVRLLRAPTLPKGPATQVAVYHFLHLCSGHRREGDLGDHLTRQFATQGAVALVENVDVGFGSQGDLTLQSVVDRLVTLAMAGLVDGVHAGPPCASWSRVRFKRPGPPPLRDRANLWGLPHAQLSHTNRAKVITANALLMAALIVIEAVAAMDGTWSLEHPADPGRAPFPSIWILDRVKRLAQAVSVHKVTFPQCMFGCPAQKLTTIWGCVNHLEAFAIPCAHR